MGVIASDIYFSLSNTELQDVIFAFPRGSVVSISKNMTREISDFGIPYIYSPYIEDFVTTNETISVKTKIINNSEDPISGQTFTIFQWKRKIEQLIKNLTSPNTDALDDDPIFSPKYFWADFESGQNGLRIGFPCIVTNLSFEIPELSASQFLNAELNLKRVTFFTE